MNRSERKRVAKMSSIDMRCVICHKDPCECKLKTSKSSSFPYAKSKTIGYVGQSYSGRFFGRPSGANSNSPKVVIKTNYAYAGKQRDGSFKSKKDIAGAVAASQSYTAREAAQDKEQTRDESLSSLYDLNGNRLSKQELADRQQELKDNGVSAMRRGIISPDPKLGLSAEDIKDIAAKTIKEFQYQMGKEFSGTIAVHSDTDTKHAHFSIYGDKKSIKWSKKELQKLKDIARAKTDEVVKQREEEQKLYRQEDKTQNIQKDKGAQCKP